MRKELELMQLIENYLQGKMSSSEKEAFEKRMQTDTALQNEVQLQENIMKGIERVGLKQSAANAFKKYKFKSNFKKWGLTGLSIAIIIVASVFVYNKVRSHHSEGEATELPELNEQGEKLWSDADKYLRLQHFELDADKDTVVETADGIVISIPAHSFLDANGKAVTGDINLEVKEALKASDIIKAGLTTKSGDKLLETGGMFYINARKDDVSLKIDPKNGLRAQIPTNEVKPGMQVFEGKRLANGTIDWVNPKPLSKDLIPVDIHSLNFYPPNYLDSLKAWGYNAGDKKYRDSLYYSFGKNPTIDWNEPELEKASQLFRQNCSVCHSLGSNKITGQGLKGVSYRVPSDDWLHQFIKNNDKLIKSGDAYAVKVSKFDASQMTVFESTLADKDIQLLVDYLKFNDGFNGKIGSVAVTEQDLIGIDPSKIRAIWDDHFQNTFIATKEFEERLFYIHHSCNDNVLEVYINNLDKNLSAVDSIITFSEVFDGSWDYSKFVEFAARGDGNVKNGDKNTELLKSYYQKKLRLYQEAITKTQQAFIKKQQEQNKKATEKRYQHEQDESERISKNYAEEFDMNLKDAYRQLGMKKPTPAPVATYAVIITTTGWNNVDKYVAESVASRADLNYTDEQSGKKAIINYEKIAVTVAEYKNYDRILVYLLPDELSSFMRLENKNEVFEEKVTNLMVYKMLCIAYKGDHAFYYSKDNVKPGATMVSLIKTDEAIIQNNINKLGKMGQVKAMNDELNYMAFEKAEAKRQVAIDEQRAFQEKTKRVVFPCMNTAAEPAKDSSKYYFH